MNNNNNNVSNGSFYNYSKRENACALFESPARRGARAKKPLLANSGFFATGIHNHDQISERKLKPRALFHPSSEVVSAAGFNILTPEMVRQSPVIEQFSEKASSGSKKQSKQSKKTKDPAISKKRSNKEKSASKLSTTLIVNNPQQAVQGMSATYVLDPPSRY